MANMSLTIPKHILLMFLSPQKLKKICAEQYALGFQINQPEYYVNNKEKIYTDGYSQYSRMIDYLRDGIVRAFWWGIGMLFSVLATWAIVKKVNLVLDSNLIGILKVSGPLLVIWSIQGRAGNKIHTFSGESIPEVINIIWSRFLYMMGMYIALVSQGL